MSTKNVIALITIVIVLVGGGVAIYKLDNGQGNRSSTSISARSASD